MDLDLLVKVWPIVVSVMTVVGGGGLLATRILMRRLDILSSDLKETNKNLNQMSTTVAVQAATLVAHTEQDRIQFNQLHEQLARVGP